MRVKLIHYKKTAMLVSAAGCILALLLFVALHFDSFSTSRIAGNGKPAGRPVSRPQHSRVEHDVRYDNTSNLNTMDLYIPEVIGDHPILIFVHGGGWTGGDKNGVPNAYGFADKGLIVAAINYRLAPRFVHPAQVQDLARAIAWLHKNAVRYGGNPKELFIAAHSTG